MNKNAISLAAASFLGAVTCASAEEAPSTAPSLRASDAIVRMIGNLSSINKSLKDQNGSLIDSTATPPQQARTCAALDMQLKVYDKIAAMGVHLGKELAASYRGAVVPIDALDIERLRMADQSWNLRAEAVILQARVNIVRIQLNRECRPVRALDPVPSP